MGFIYKITNILNEKVYIGQTRCSVDGRWKEHIDCSYNKSSSAYDGYLHRAIRKYGVSAFLVEQIEECDNSMLDEREIYWIKQYHSMGKGYNLTHGGGGRFLYTEEELLSEWNKGKNAKEISESLGIDLSQLTARLGFLVGREEVRKRKIASTAKSNRKPVYQYGYDGRFIAEYESIDDARAKTGFGSIKRAFSKGNGVANGYQWRRYKVDSIEPYTPEPVARRIYQYALNGEYVGEFDSAESAARLFGKESGNLYAVLRGEQLSFSGFQWSLEKHDRIEPILDIEKEGIGFGKRICQLDGSGNLIKVFPSIYRAAKETNSAHASISVACRTGKMSKGYYWKYEVIQGEA